MKSILQKILEKSPEAKSILAKKVRSEFQKEIEELSDDEIIKLASNHTSNIDFSTIFNSKNEFLDIHIDDLDISVRAYNGLSAVKIFTLRDFIKHKPDEVLKFRNFGKKSLVEIRDLLKKNGIDYPV